MPIFVNLFAELSGKAQEIEDPFSRRLESVAQVDTCSLGADRIILVTNVLSTRGARNPGQGQRKFEVWRSLVHARKDTSEVRPAY